MNFVHLHPSQKLGYMIKPISISLSPNTERDDVILAWKLLFQPRRWKKGKVAEQLEQKFEEYLKVRHAFSFNSGRSALMAILEAMEIKKGDEVLLQAFTCNVAVNPILNRGAKPIFIDVDETINMDPDDLKKKITLKSKAVMIQHNFGWPAQIEEISEIVKKNNLYLIEDCTHSLGAEYKGKKIGTFGNASFFSFSRDKVISSVFGGMAVTNDGRIAERIKKFREELNYPSNFWILQQLLHPILMNWLILPCYGLNQYLGRIVLGFLHKISILSKAVYKKEKRGERVKYFPKKLPNALAMLALNQFQKLERLNRHRREIAEFYKRNLKNRFLLPLSKGDQDRTPVFMRYPVLVDELRSSSRFTNARVMDDDTDDVLKKARKRKIFLDDGWRKSPIVPLDTDLKKMNYNLGSCPKAEKIAKRIVNLPTHINISEKEAQRIVNFLKIYGSRRKLRSLLHLRSASPRLVIKEIQNKEIWENFLLECEEKTFLSSWNWGEFQKMSGNKIWRLGVFEANGDPLSVALVVRVQARRGTFLFVPHGPNIKSKIKNRAPSPRGGGEGEEEDEVLFAFQKSKILEALLNELKKIAKEENCSFIKIAPILIRNEENIEIFKNLGFREAPIHIHPEITWELNLEKSEEELLMDMRKTTRYLIRQAFAKGEDGRRNKFFLPSRLRLDERSSSTRQGFRIEDLKIKKSQNPKDIEIFNTLYQKTVNRHHFIPFSLNYLKNEFSAFLADGQILVFLAEYQGECLASAIIIFWQGMAFYHQGASSQKYPKIPASHLLQWEVIKEAKKRGCKIYNFWGIIPIENFKKHPWYGLTLFKMGFGGYKKEYVKTQDLPLSIRYWLTFAFEKLRKKKRGF
ncbi:hypothetical protein COX73_01460 [bacterium (Candidatus Gribaldobacteria) CG_4_10_14_0_2_um_filter_36_18]|uniref:BioF2-like acetyltransferase domain-containing protein n=1 Tax=bacterium (Candidatus Gribaldobacteria) CG_4_10_14_0_2_um_filter_36_18 TaxID=2014264 RepID=A0A2M7VKI1_9BACT|nr:MAG: hypothetical protein COX73_01460 [bacterium (Candidatus Gribaldobacteria) CG_4_10_14_0_2_um_filter_36_18]